MAKTIKFNIILDNCPVRNIEGLQEHFSIEDILKYFYNGLLLRWLDVRGYHKQYNEVKAIDKSLDKKEIIMTLINIFEITETETTYIQETLSILDYLDKEKEMNEIYNKNSFEKRQIINDYHSGYLKLIEHMEENKKNMAILKADTLIMEKEYYNLFKLDYEALYFRLIKNAPKAVFAILTRNAFRKFWIGEDACNNISTSMEMSLLSEDKAKKILGKDLKIIKRDTEGMWDQIERPEVKIMVISIGRWAFVKNAGNFSEKLGYNDVNNKLLLFNGLEYQCNEEYSELLYMEV